MSASSTMDLSPTPMSNKCYICYSKYEKGVNHQSNDYQLKVIRSCADTLMLLSEKTSDEFNWNLMMCKEILPFCPSCWQSVEIVHDLNQRKETTEKFIVNIVKNLACKALPNRQYLKKKGVISTSENNLNGIQSFGNGIKVEDMKFSLNPNIKCRICHNMYIVGETTNLFSLDFSQKVTAICQQHLFPELIDEGFFDWDSIPFNNFVPFCQECSQNIKSIIDMDEKLQEIEIFISSNLGVFAVNVLKCRKSLTTMKRHGFQYKNGFSNDTSPATAVSTNHHDLIDLDDDCQIINDLNFDVHPNNFVQTTLQEPAGQFMEQPSPSHSLPSSVNNSYIKEIQVEETVAVISESSTANPISSLDNYDSRPNSADTCIVTPQKCTSIQNMTNVEQGDSARNGPILSAVLRMRSRDENISIVDNQLNGPSGPIRRFSMQNIGTIFKCQNCEKKFIYRKAWELHAAKCTKQIESTPVMKICCGQAFSDDHSLVAHRISDKCQPIAQSEPNSTPAGSQPQSPPVDNPPIPLEHQCNFCEKRFKTKRGLNIHASSHSRSIRRSSQRLKGDQIIDTSDTTTTLISPKRLRSTVCCRFCPIPVFTKKDLIDHIQSHYNIATGFRCELCQMVFSNKKSLETHDISFHKKSG